MHQLSNFEIDKVSGAAGYGQTVGTVSMVTGGAAIGNYFVAARLGATFGSAAGPFGALVGAIVGGSGAYLYYHYTSSAR